MGGVVRAADERTTNRLVGVVWALLVVNTLGASSPEAIIPVPHRLAQLLTMGALLLAFAIALLLNPRLRVRPSGVLLLLTLLLISSVVASGYFESGFGAIARCIRFALFLATLWLLTPFWDGSVRFVRYHVQTLSVVLLTVVAGLAIAPGAAMPADFDNRLTGVLWFLEATQVGDYAAVVAGLTTMLWLTRRIDGRSALLIALTAFVVLLLTHTRTATFAMLIGLAVGIVSLATTNLRARRAIGVGLVGAGLAGVMWKAIQTWVLRGQDADDFSSLTGRQVYWDAVLAKPRTVREEWLGVGLTDKSYGGLPIDSSWLVVYHEQGFVGIGLVALCFVVLLGSIFLRSPSPARACAILLVVHVLLASYTQVGLGDASTYMLHLVVAATCLVRGETPAPPWRPPARAREQAAS